MKKRELTDFLHRNAGKIVLTLILSVVLLNSTFALSNNIIINSYDNIIDTSLLMQEPYPQQTVRGTVKDEFKTLLPGVSIVIKGTSRGTSSDFDGKYSIEANSNDVIIFSYLGFVTQEIAVGSKTQVDVTMIEDISKLDEVVVIGFGTQKKSDLTGSIATVNPNETKDMKNYNLLQSINGKAAGVYIGSPDSPGKEPSYQIRGTNSLSASNTPLVVVDGIIYNGSLNNINVDDINSIDILKDASAAAVYGSRSANGVIIITTKEGRKGKPILNFSTSIGISDDVTKIPVYGPEGYNQKLLDSRAAAGRPADPAKIADYLPLKESNNYLAGRTVDWYDELINTGYTQDYSLSVSGGSENSSYFMSASYLNADGIVKYDDFERTTIRLNLSTNITNWFKLSVKSSFASQDDSGVPPLNGEGLTPMSPFGSIYKDGNKDNGLEQFPMEDTYFQNPFLNALIDDNDKSSELWGLVSSEINIPFIDGLKWTLNYSMSGQRHNEYRFKGNWDKSATKTNGSGRKKISDIFSWTLDNILNYDRTFNDVHSVNATFLMSREYQQGQYTTASATQFFNQNLGYNNLGVGTTPSVESGLGEQNQQALMGRLNYTYNSKYGITGTIRRDGFSGFADGNKYATFYSGALAWTVSNEDFMKDVSWLNRLKLRLSYGENGNQAIGRYQTLARMSTIQTVFGDGGSPITGVYVNSMANNKLGWETTKVTNLGMDFGILDNAIWGSIDIYDSNTENLLVDQTLPSHSGFTSVKNNLGKINNKGMEIALNSTPIRSDRFSWNLGVIFSMNENEIVSLFGIDNDGDGLEDDVIANNWFIGEPLGVIYGYGIDGIYQTGETGIPTGYHPGDFRIVDYDGDGELTPNDRHILGYSVPKYTFSISNTVNYDNWSLYFMVNSIQGGDRYYRGNNMATHNPNNPFDGYAARFNIPQMDYWTPTNPSNTVARIDYSPPRSHAYLEDRSFLRIQDINLSYSFGKDVLDRWKGVDVLRLFLSSKNLYTFTKWTGFDPENGTTAGDYPMLRTFTFGINFGF